MLDHTSYLIFPIPKGVSWRIIGRALSIRSIRRIVSSGVSIGISYLKQVYMHLIYLKVYLITRIIIYPLSLIYKSLVVSYRAYLYLYFLETLFESKLFGLYQPSSRILFAGLYISYQVFIFYQRVYILKSDC